MPRPKANAFSTAGAPVDPGTGPIEVIGAGLGWLAVDKPAGLTVHNAPGRDLCARVERMLRDDATLRERVRPAGDGGVHPAHRLDRETSGVVLLAVDREVLRFFGAQFEARQVVKRYVALLHGCLAPPDTGDRWGTWRWGLSGAAAGRRNPAGSGRKQACETRFRVIGHSLHYTRVEIDLGTGRKHQIRRHAALAGHPVVGDARYGSTRAVTYLRQNKGFERLALHSRELTLRLPGAIRRQTLATAAFPPAFEALFAADRDAATGKSDARVPRGVDGDGGMH